MSWQGFLDGQDGVAFQNDPRLAWGYTAQWLEANAHMPYEYPVVAPTGSAMSGIAPSAVATSTGVNPVESGYSVYGKTIPLSVLGHARIGGNIIVGPWIGGGLASFGISFGFPADPTGSRTLYEIAFDSEIVWDSTNGFSTEAFTYRFYEGTLTQAADPLEIAHFGVNAVAYRPQMLIFFENLPLAGTKFGKIPYVAARIADDSGQDVNLGEAFERLAYSPFVGYTSAQFETTGITDSLVNGGMIFAEQAEFLGTIQQFGRFYPKWDILQTDKLRIVDRGATVTADFTLNKTRLMGKVVLSRQGPDTVRRGLELSTIDPDADYTIIPSLAQRPLVPVPVTTSVGKDSAYLPVIMDAQTRMSIVTYAKYHEEAARRAISGTAMMYGLEMEPGDLVAITDLGDDFQNEIFKVRETLHGVNCTVEFTAESILNCESSRRESPVVTIDYGSIHQSASVHTGTLPTTRVTGNLLILFFKSRNTANDPTVAAGWTQLDTFGFGGGGQRFGVYYRFVTGTEAAPVITCAGGSAIVSAIVQYSGTDPTTPLVAGTKNGAATGTSITCTAITSTRAASLAISATWDDLSIESSLPSGFSDDLPEGALQNVFGSLRVASRQISTLGGSSGAVAATQSSSVPWGTFLFELRSPA